jgi:voltage-gated potassium channel
MTQQRYRDLADWPLTLTALIFLTAYASQVIGRIEGSAAFWLEAIMWATWVIFAVDYLANLWLADDRGSWFVRNLHELLIVALPFFRPLRLLRLVTLLSVLHRTLGDTLRGRVVTYVVGSATMLVFVGALAVLDVEQSAPEAKILTFGDALWWAITTITTVGYGDMYPVTPLGRVVAAALMMSGIAVLWRGYGLHRVLAGPAGGGHRRSGGRGRGAGAGRDGGTGCGNRIAAPRHRGAERPVKPVAASPAAAGSTHKRF